MKNAVKVGGCLLAVAPNGARKSKADHPRIPLSAKELAVTAIDCLAAGAAMIHLHVRNADGSHSLSAEHYAEAIIEIEKSTNDGILIQVTSEAVGIYTADEQFEMIHKLQPSAVSIGLREIKNLNESIINNHFEAMRDAKTHPQLILYNEADLSLCKDWLERKVIPGSAYPLLLVIGKKMTEPSFDNGYLRPDFIDALPASSWMICAFGENEFETAKLAASLGGHIRIGFENNSVLADGSIASDNAELIAQTASYLNERGIQVADLEQAIEIMKPDW